MNKSMNVRNTNMCKENLEEHKDIPSKVTL